MARALTHADTILTGKEWNNYVVGLINDYSEALRSPVKHLKERGEAQFAHEISYAMHLNINSIVVALPQDMKIENFARILNQASRTRSSRSFSIREPVSWCAYHSPARRPTRSTSSRS